MTRQRLENIAASLFLLALCVAVYASIPYLQHYFSPRAVFMGMALTHWQLLKACALGYGALLLVYYLVEPNPKTSKSVMAVRAVARLLTSFIDTWQRGLPEEEKTGLLSILLKAFFAPLMIVWLLDHTLQMHRNGVAIFSIWGHPDLSYFSLFSAHGFWFLFQVILLLDVFFFTIGYLIEMPFLKNEIRSVDPTLAGWAVALACYPPFNGVMNNVLGWHSSDFPQFGIPALHLAANIFLLLLMAIYTWASVALNFKASNLTHRGIIDSGPYRYIRHPAYVCKNLAWWLGLIPAAMLAWHNSITAALLVIASMVGWSLIYTLRALTEESHLRSVNEEYEQYCQRVKYRFIPGLV